MTDACPDCGRPHARDACSTCGRSRSAPWPVSTLVMGEGKGGPGRKRVGGKHGVRRFQLSVKLDATLAGRIKATANERGHTLGQTIRDLVEDGYRYRANKTPPSALTVEQRAALSRPGTEVQRPPERMQPVIGGGGRFER